MARYHADVSRFTAALVGHRFQAAAALVALAAAWPLLSQLAAAQPGLINSRGGGDSPFLLQRLHQLAAALAGGHFPVRWMPDANYGYGYPFYNFYAPLSIYVAALFRLLGFSLVRAILLAQLAGFLVAAWATYHLGRRWLSGRWGGLLAAAAYTLAPFHLVNVYVRGDSLAEFWAMAFYPLALLAADHLLRAGPTRRGVALLAAAFAGLTLSHNISALLFTPFLLLFALSAGRPWRPAARPAVAAAGLALLLGLALSAWFWLPALVERDLAQLGPVTSGYFHYANHFRGADLAQTSLLFDYDVAGGRAFRMGLVQAALALAGTAALLWSAARARRETGHSSRPRPPRLFILLALLLATLMITPLSRSLWDHLPLLSFSQFPWRFLSVQALAGALATGALAWLPGRRLLVPALVGLLLVAALGRLRPDFLPLGDGDVTAARLAGYEWFTANVGSTVSAEYLPPTVQPRPYNSAWLQTGHRYQVDALEGELIAAGPLAWRATRQEWRVTAGPDGATLRFPTLYWPGWRATVDGQAAAVGPADGSGLIRLAVPPGDHTVTLALGRTPARLAAELLSLAAVALWLVVAGPRISPAHLRRALPAAAALLALAAGLRLWPLPAVASGDLTWDFAQMGYLHHSPGAVRFDNGDRLAWYDYDAETLTAGDTLAITLHGHWSDGPVTLALVTPAVMRFPDAPLLVANAISGSGERLLFSLSIPENAPVGLYLPRLTGRTALTPAGQPRGDLFLRPVRVLPATATAPPLDGRSMHVRADGAAVRPDGALEVWLAWWTPRPLSHNYNVSLRLSDAAGLELARYDGQPGYGFWPSSLWPAGRWTQDRLALPLPVQLSGSAPYALTIRLYDVAGGQPVLFRRLGELALQDGRLVLRATQPIFTLPAGVTTYEATFGQVVRLRGYELARDDGQLRLTLYWQARADGRDDYSHFVHLLDDRGEIVAQHDAVPRFNTYPTSQWTAGEIVADPAILHLQELPAGRYHVVVGLYRLAEDGQPRLPAVDGQGRPLPDNRLLLPLEIVWP